MSSTTVKKPSRAKSKSSSSKPSPTKSETKPSSAAVSRLDESGRWALLNALRSGTVPDLGTEEIAVGLEPQLGAIEEGLRLSLQGRSGYKFLRGDYGAGKTFLSSLVASRAADLGLLFSKVVISAADTPLYRPVSLYRRICEGLSRSPRQTGGQFRGVLDRWLYRLEEKVVELHGLDEDDENFGPEVSKLVDRELLALGDQSGRLAACLKAYHQAQLSGDYQQATALLDWMSGEDKVAASMKRTAGVTGKLEDRDAFAFLRGLLEVIRSSSASPTGLVVIIDEVETVLRLRRPERMRSLEVLRQLVDACDRHEFPGLYLLFTGTPDFFESPQGVPALPPLHDRLKVTFDEHIEDNLRQPQIRLKAFDQTRLAQVARKVRALYPSQEDLSAKVSDQVIEVLTQAMTCGFGGHIEVIPRLFLRRWVDLLDRADQHPDFVALDFLQQRGWTPPEAAELTDQERAFWDPAQEITL